uniref:Uncharacterized protein n=1 Tax=Acrobeloides nanus TaxID=290746 RepID=A0A914CKH3_9BILA
MNVFLLVVKCFISMSSSVDCLQLILIYVLIASNCNLVPGSSTPCPTKDLVEIPIKETMETIAINYSNKTDVEKTGFHFTVKMPDIMFDTGLPRCTIA